MSKHPKHLWQRLKLLLRTKQATLDPQDDTVTTSKAAEGKVASDKAASYDGQTSPAYLPNIHSNAAFDEDCALSGVLPLANQSTDADEGAISPDEIEQILVNMGYQFMYHPADDEDAQRIYHYTMQVSDKERHWGCMIRFFAEQQLIAVYSIYPTAIAEANRPEMLAMLAYLNYDLMIGNLEMDVMDGELRFKTSLDLEVTGVNELIMSYLLQSNFSLFSRLHDTISEMIEQPHISHDLQGAMDKLVQSQKSRNFFLASDAIQ